METGDLDETFAYLQHHLSKARISIINYSFNALEGTEREQKREERDIPRRKCYQFVIADHR